MRCCRQELTVISTGEQLHGKQIAVCRCLECKTTYVQTTVLQRKGDYEKQQKLLQRIRDMPDEVPGKKTRNRSSPLGGTDEERAKRLGPLDL